MYINLKLSNWTVSTLKIFKLELIEIGNVKEMYLN